MTTIHDISSALDGFVQAVCSWDSNGYLKQASDSQSANTASRNRADLCTLDDLLQECARGMAQLRRVRATVASELNSYAPVNLLPDEILALIFEYHDAGASYFGHYDDRPIHPSVVVSSVCTRWRAVALVHPALWSRIDLNASRAHLGCLFERARGYPLSLFYDYAIASGLDQSGALPSEPGVTGILEANLARVQSLELEGLPDQRNGRYEEIADALFRTEAPLLRELIMSSDRDFALTRPLFGGHAPHLRHVTVSGIDMAWDTGLFRNLSSLTIKNGGIDFRPGTDICDIVRSCPRLESLSLQRLVLAGSRTRGCTPRMELAHLRTVTLNLPASDICHILSSFELPAVHSMLLTPRVVQTPHHGSDEIPPLCEPGLLPRPLLASITHLHITFTERAGYFDHVSLHTVLSGRSSDGTSVFSLSWYLADAVGGTDAFLVSVKVAQRLKTHYFPASIPTLVLESSFEQLDHPLWPFLIRIPGVRNLALKGQDDESVLSAAFIEDMSELMPDVLALRKLTLQRLKLDEDSLQALSACCQKLGGGLEILIFEDVKLVASDEVVNNAMDGLRSLVVRVDVNDLTSMPPTM